MSKKSYRTKGNKMVNTKGNEKKPVSNGKHPSGGQGEQGSKLKGSKIKNVSNPKRIEPTKIGGGMGPMSRPGTQPKVGK